MRSKGTNNTSRRVVKASPTRLHRRTEIMKTVVDQSAKTIAAADGATQNSKAYLLPLARLLMSSLFIWDGILQLRNPSGTAQYFASVHVPLPDLAIWVSMPIHLL